jgi:hypothetical protein
MGLLLLLLLLLLLYNKNLYISLRFLKCMSLNTHALPFAATLKYALSKEQRTQSTVPNECNIWPSTTTWAMISCVDLSNLSVTGCVTSAPAIIQSPVYKATRPKTPRRAYILNTKSSTSSPWRNSLIGTMHLAGYSYQLHSVNCASWETPPSPACVTAHIVGSAPWTNTGDWSYGSTNSWPRNRMESRISLPGLLPPGIGLCYTFKTTLNKFAGLLGKTFCPATNQTTNNRLSSP